MRKESKLKKLLTLRVEIFIKIKLRLDILSCIITISVSMRIFKQRWFWNQIEEDISLAVTNYR